MKKYGICLLLFLVISFGCLGIGFVMTRNSMLEGEGVPGTTLESETVIEERQVLNIEEVEPIAEEIPREEFYLVSEAGYLLVFGKDQSTICLYTHIPITDFPQKERERLMEGIWFPTMLDVFHYLESYTS